MDGIEVPGLRAIGGQSRRIGVHACQQQVSWRQEWNSIPWLTGPALVRLIDTSEMTIDEAVTTLLRAVADKQAR